MRRWAKYFSLLTVLGGFAVGLVCFERQGLTQEEKTPTKKAVVVIDEPQDSAENDNAPATVAEARARARMLHEAFHGALQVMHRDFFDENEKHRLPVKSLEDVFEEMASRQHVKLKWIAVDTKAMSIGHKPDTEFEHAAVKALSSGESEFESSEDGVFKFAGTVRLSAHCLKCHKPGRTSNEARSAGLVITMPLKKK